MRAGIIDAIIALDSVVNRKLYLPVNGDRYHLKDHDCLDQTAQSDFEVREDRNPAFPCRFSGLKIYVC